MKSRRRSQSVSEPFQAVSVFRPLHTPPHLYRATRRLNIGVNMYSRPASDSNFWGSQPSLPSLTVGRLGWSQLRQGSSFDSHNNQCLRYSSTGCLLNITPSISHLSAPPPRSCTASTPQRSPNPPTPSTGPVSASVLAFEENPLAEFVKLQEEALEGELWYSNVLCGVLRGALEMVSLLS